MSNCHVTNFPCSSDNKADHGRTSVGDAQYTGQVIVKYQILQDPLIKRPVEIILGCGDGSYVIQNRQLYGAWENGHPTLASWLCDDGRICCRRFLYGYEADHWFSFLDKYFLPSFAFDNSNSNSSSSNSKGTLRQFGC